MYTTRQQGGGKLELARPALSSGRPSKFYEFWESSGAIKHVNKASCSLGAMRQLRTLGKYPEQGRPRPFGSTVVEVPDFGTSFFSGTHCRSSPFFWDLCVVKHFCPTTVAQGQAPAAGDCSVELAPACWREAEQSQSDGGSCSSILFYQQGKK